MQERTPTQIQRPITTPNPENSPNSATTSSETPDGTQESETESPLGLPLLSLFILNTSFWFLAEWVRKKNNRDALNLFEAISERGIKYFGEGYDQDIETIKGVERDFYVKESRYSLCTLIPPFAVVNLTGELGRRLILSLQPLNDQKNDIEKSNSPSVEDFYISALGYPPILVDSRMSRNYNNTINDLKAREEEVAILLFQGINPNLGSGRAEGWSLAQTLPLLIKNTSVPDRYFRMGGENWEFYITYLYRTYIKDYEDYQAKNADQVNDSYPKMLNEGVFRLLVEELLQTRLLRRNIEDSKKRVIYSQCDQVKILSKDAASRKLKRIRKQLEHVLWKSETK